MALSLCRRPNAFLFTCQQAPLSLPKHAPPASPPPPACPVCLPAHPLPLLLAPWQVLDLAELDFSRYGDVLFEVAFAGARLTTGGNVATEGKKLDFNVSL